MTKFPEKWSGGEVAGWKFLFLEELRVVPER
jgi:hypothetical protein